MIPDEGKLNKPYFFMKYLSRHKLLDALFFSLRPNQSWIVPMGKHQPGVLMINVYRHEAFTKLPLSKKIVSLLSGLRLSDEEISEIARQHARKEAFGDEADFGDFLFPLNVTVLEQEINLDPLTAKDLEKIQALGSASVLVRNEFVGVSSYPPLNLHLAQSCPLICQMILPMSKCVLVQSVRFYVEINAHYTFASIRTSGHPCQDNILSFLYEILFLQQKTALAMLEFLRLMECSQNSRRDDETVMMTLEDIESVLKADLIVSYLKASVEKFIALVAEIFELPATEKLKRHDQKVNLLTAKLEEKHQKTPYGQFLLENIKSENLEKLNSLRTGIFHKKGAYQLQPHSFTNKKHEDLQSRELLSLFLHHHKSNSIAIIGCLAMLTDILIAREIKTMNNEAALRSSWENLLVQVMNRVPSESRARFSNWVQEAIEGMQRQP